MPQLPTVTVTDAQASRILAVFGDAAAYRAWLAQQIRAKVLAGEADALRAELSQKIEARRVAIEQELGGMA